MSSTFPNPPAADLIAPETVLPIIGLAQSEPVSFSSFPVNFCIPVCGAELGDPIDAPCGIAEPTCKAPLPLLLLLLLSKLPIVAPCGIAEPTCRALVLGVCVGDCVCVS